VGGFYICEKSNSGQEDSNWYLLAQASDCPSALNTADEQSNEVIFQRVKYPDESYVEAGEQFVDKQSTQLTASPNPNTQVIPSARIVNEMTLSNDY